ncbi:MAG: Tm-1-like ATP-binding domain-containing protein [Nanoarchaeota archaeon]
MRKTIALVATLDTKGREAQFIKSIITKNGINCILIDVGLLGKPLTRPDITNIDVIKKAGEKHADLVKNPKRSIANPILSKGATRIVLNLINKGRIHGIISIGGSQGTAIGTYVMRQLPIGFPKLMVSTMASGDVRHYVDTCDITMMYSVSDISGLNFITTKILENAANAISGMVKNRQSVGNNRQKTLALTMYGSTTPCVTRAAERLRHLGYEVIIFHASGPGGKAMENLIFGGKIDGVLDLTIGEVSNEYMGGIQSTGPIRLTQAAKMRIPLIVVPGGACTCVFGPKGTVPKKYQKRTLIIHNPSTTLIRANRHEAAKIGKIIAQRMNLHKGRNMLIIPELAFCCYYEKGMPFHNPQADKALIDAITRNLTGNTIIEKYALRINDPAFADIVADKMNRLMKNESV